MQCVDVDESSSQLSQGIDDFVRYLNSPKLGIFNTLNSEQDQCVMRLPSAELVTEMKGKSSAVLCEMDKKDRNQPSMDKTKSESAIKSGLMSDSVMKSGLVSSSDVDEAVELSFDSATSSSGFKDARVTFTCDSSPETSDLDLSSERISTDSKCSSKKKDKDKESKRRRFKKMITRPLRRSKSAGCANDVPAHAMFAAADKTEDKDQATMEDHSVELDIYDERLRVDNLECGDRESKKVHKTRSADAATMASTGLTHVTKANVQTKAKPKKSGFSNVKRKFQFLRRRNTDMTLVPKFSLSQNFIIPTHDQALRWSQSFEFLLNDKSGLELFMGFLKSEFSEENLEFWIACEELRIASETKVPAMAQNIYTEFVGFNAPKEVNLDSTTRMNTKENLENPSRETFQVAQRKIQALMEKDSYSRFIESELYQHLLSTLSKS